MQTTLVMLLLVATPIFVAAQEVSVSGYRAPAKSASSAQTESLPLELKVARGEAPVSKLYDHIKLESSALLRLPPLKASEMKEEASNKRLRIGAVRLLPKRLTPSSDARAFSLPEGEVSLLGIASEEALQVRVHFTDVNLPKGARIFVYSPTNPEEVYGPFKGRGHAGTGEFWTPPVRGSEIIVEYYEPHAAQKTHTSQPFKISEVTHIYKGLDGSASSTEKASGSCHLSVTSEWSEVAKSVGQMEFVSDGGSFLCTGTLLSNAARDGTPNFLTANHCINTEAEAQSLRVIWFYNAPGARSSFTDGSTLLAKGRQSDFALLRLTGTLPGGLVYSGWTTTMPSASTSVTGIHHPVATGNQGNQFGDFKRISFGNIRSEACRGVASCLPVGWRSGTTEGGSSGSGIWTGSPSDAKLVGTLNGGDASCQNQSGSDFYGRFDTTFQSISFFLTGTGSPPARPANDDFALATAINSNTGSITGSNVNATKESGEPSHAGDSGGSSVWYRWQAPASGTTNFTTASSNFDTLLAVYTGTSVNALTPIASNDDESLPNDILTSRVTFNAVAGTTYYIAVDGFDGDAGSITLAWDSPAAPTPTPAPIDLTGVSAEVRAWTISGRTEAFVKVNFPDDSYTVTGWGAVTRNGADFTADAQATRGARNVAVPTATANIYNLGALGAGDYAFTFRVNGTTLRTQTFTVGGAAQRNSIDDAEPFARQQYLDFLNRTPDAPGLAFWTSEITVCGSDPACLDRKRANTSGAFFLSEEFQVTGYYVYRIYRGSLGRVPYHAEFVPDASRVAAGIVVDNRLSAEAINRNKAEFAKEFVARAEFLAAYGSLTEEQFVDRLFQTTGAARTDAERQALINELRSGAGTLVERRASVLRKVVDGVRAVSPANGGVGVDQVFETSYGRAFYDAHFNRAFVLMQYFGYLRRDPDAGGYQFWLDKLNRFGGNFHDAEMVKAFIVSAEYRSRFGQP